MDSAPTTRRRHRRGLRTVAAVACAAAAGTLGVGTASASPEVESVTTQQTLRIVDGDAGLLFFVNKSREDLCTPERLTFEADLQAWLDGGMVGEPPAEPAESQQGVSDVVVTTRTVGDRELLTIVGDEVPVEIWRLDDEGGGVDCTATDGPGAELFASGPMDLGIVRRQASDHALSGDSRVAGVVLDTEGNRWNVDLRYLLTAAGDNVFSVRLVSRVVELG